MMDDVLHYCILQVDKINRFEFQGEEREYYDPVQCDVLYWSRQIPIF